MKLAGLGFEFGLVSLVHAASGTESLGRTFRGEASGPCHDLRSIAGIDFIEKEKTLAWYED